MLSGIMLSFIMMSVVLLRVIAPFFSLVLATTEQNSSPQMKVLSGSLSGNLSRFL
jgi:hypothetical protein